MTRGTTRFMTNYPTPGLTREIRSTGARCLRVAPFSIVAIAILSLILSASAAELKHKPSSVKKSTPSSARYRLAPTKTQPQVKTAKTTPSAPERIRYSLHGPHSLSLHTVPSLKSTRAGRVVGVGPRGEDLVFTVDSDLQAAVSKIVSKSRSPHIAVVAMDPYTGRILALAERSQTVKNPSVHNGFPAASLFKLVTTSAALESRGLSPETIIPFRGGTYTLNSYNYRPDPKKDTRRMTLTEALGRSCNPVFGRVASRFLNESTLRQYASLFGFNSTLRTDLPLKASPAYIPSDPYQLARTAAGFGKISISPIHAAALTSGIANGGHIPVPFLVERVVDDQGRALYSYEPQIARRALSSSTASTLLQMMKSTVTIGTSRNAFYSRSKPILPHKITVAAKTGTLTGDSPRGRTNWFVGAAPVDNPQIALAVVVVDSRDYYSASRLGRMVIEEFFKK